MFPEGVAFSVKAFERTVVTSSVFEYLRPLDASHENFVDHIFTSWNTIATYAPAGEVKTGSFALEKPTATDIERRRNLK